jgi:hypothetical protein
LIRPTASAREFAWTVKQAIEALLAANDRDTWGFHHIIFGANGWPVAKIEVEAKPKQPVRPLAGRRNRS